MSIKNYFTKTIYASKTFTIKILWEGWYNTGQDRPYFHYGPFGRTKANGGGTDI